MAGCICYIEMIKIMLLEPLDFESDSNNVFLSLSNRYNTLGLLTSLDFASGSKNVFLSLSNRDDTLSYLLIFLGFTSNVNKCFGYYLLINR